MLSLSREILLRGLLSSPRGRQHYHLVKVNTWDGRIRLLIHLCGAALPPQLSSSHLSQDEQFGAEPSSLVSPWCPVFMQTTCCERSLGFRRRVLMHIFDSNFRWQTSSIWGTLALTMTDCWIKRLHAQFAARRRFSLEVWLGWCCWGHFLLQIEPHGFPSSSAGAAEAVPVLSKTTSSFSKNSSSSSVDSSSGSYMALCLFAVRLQWSKYSLQRWGDGVLAGASSSGIISSSVYALYYRDVSVNDQHNHN